MPKRRISLDTYGAITALLMCAVIGLSIVFSFMVYNFSVVRNQILDNEKLIRDITSTNLNNTFKNRDNIMDILKNLTQEDNKLDKLLNQISSSK